MVGKYVFEYFYFDFRHDKITQELFCEAYLANDCCNKPKNK